MSQIDDNHVMSTIAALMSAIDTHQEINEAIESLDNIESRDFVLALGDGVRCNFIQEAIEKLQASIVTLDSYVMTGFEYMYKHLSELPTRSETLVVKGYSQGLFLYAYECQWFREVDIWDGVYTYCYRITKEKQPHWNGLVYSRYYGKSQNHPAGEPDTPISPD